MKLINWIYNLFVRLVIWYNEAKLQPGVTYRKCSYCGNRHFFNVIPNIDPKYVDYICDKCDKKPLPPPNYDKLTQYFKEK